MRCMEYSIFRFSSTICKYRYIRCLDDLLNNLDLNLDKYKKYDYRNEFDIISNKKEDIEDIFTKYIDNNDK